MSKPGMTWKAEDRLNRSRDRSRAGDDAHGRFRRDVDRIPKMDAWTEREEMERYAAGDAEAGRRVVAGNLRLAMHMARAFSGRNQSMYEEILSAAMEGLAYALTTFDPRMGTRFWSFAQHHCRIRIQRHMHRNRRIVATPHHEPARKAVRAFRSHEPASVEELASIAGITLTQAADAWVTAALSDAYMGDEDALRDNGRAVGTGGDYRAASSTMMVTINPDATIDHDRMSYAVRLAVMKLEPLEQAIARRRLMSDEPETLQAIGDTYGLSREWIRKVEVEVKSKLRRALRKYKEAA